MRQSELFVKIKREAPRDEESTNAQLLIRAGFIDKLAAGVYTFLPLGLKVLNKIENIIREEMNEIGGQEILMPALHPNNIWQTTGRWRTFDTLFKTKSKYKNEYALGPTHEEVVYSLLTDYIKSYRDLPLYLYQIQTKFRDEPRAKSGLLRNREFRMKDLYSFHAGDKDRDAYYEKVRNAYRAIFRRLGLKAIETRASGGTFSDVSLEFQVISKAGEDVIFVCENCRNAVNREIGSGIKCFDCGTETKEEKSIEVGNIFPLKEKFAKDFNLVFKDQNGKATLVSAGCYGLGVSRAMGAIVETRNDEYGIIWPESVAPFKAHLIEIRSRLADKICQSLQKAGIEVLYDDRKEVSAGEKFAEADLIGVPFRLVVSEKTGDKIEIKKRSEKKTKLVGEKELIKLLQVQ